MSETIRIENVKIAGRSEKAIKLVFRRNGSMRNVWLAYSQITIGQTQPNETVDFVEVASWLWHTAVEPLRGQGWIPPFSLPKTPANTEKICDVRDGTYTAVFDNNVENYCTLRVNTSRKKKNFRIVSYLFGPDNTNDFRGFASPVGNNLRFWGSFQCSPETRTRFERAWNAIIDNPEKAGEDYALRSNRCYRCHHPLTVAVSIHRGLGPDCYANLYGG